MEMKICKECGNNLELHMFSKSKSGKNRLNNKCKDCVKICYKIYSKKFNDNNKEKFSDYYKANKIKKLACSNQYHKDNLEKMNKYNLLYRIANEEKLKDYNREYTKNNKDKVNIKHQIRRARQKKLPSTLTMNQWGNIKQDFNSQCCYCGKRVSLAQEHFIAVTKGGEYTVNNIVPSCRSCNSSKGVKDFFEWYPKYKYYSKNRERFILKFLNYKDGIQQLKII